MSYSVIDNLGDTGFMRERRLPVPLPLLIAAGVIIVVVVVFALRACSQSQKSPSPVQMVTTAAAITTSTAHLQNLQAPGNYELNPTDFLQIPGSTNVVAVNLAGEPTMNLSNQSLANIRDALDSMEEDTQTEFVFVDVGTGRGIAYNADADLYIASAAKAVLISYVLSQHNELDAADHENIQHAITESDNESYEAIAERYIDENYVAWLTTHSVTHESPYIDFYPAMSARSLASFWAEILKLTKNDTADTRWFTALLSATETSFIRDALIGTDAKVYNKGGWIGEEGYASVTDAGIIECGGRTYIMAIISSQSDGGDAEQHVTDLAQALFNARREL